MYRWTLSFRILSVILRNVRLSFRLVAEVLIPPVPAHLPCFRLSSPEEEGRTPEYPRDSRRRAGRSVLPSSPQTAREPGAVLPLTRCSNRAPGVEWLGRGHPAPKFQGQRGQGQIRAATARRHSCPERPGRGYSCQAGGGQRPGAAPVLRGISLHAPGCSVSVTFSAIHKSPLKAPVPPAHALKALLEPAVHSPDALENPLNGP